MEAVFVDTNVFIYARDPADPAKRAQALEWLSVLWKDGTGRTSVQVLAEFYVNVTRKLASPVAPEDAWHEVEALLTWRPQAIDSQLLVRARLVEERSKLSWWDAMVVAAAQMQDCGILLTEDLQDGGRFGDVVVRSPFTLSVHEAPERYAARPVSARHRARGRPRRRAAAL